MQEVADGAREYSVGWGTLAMINAGIAQGKNRSGLNWFLLSLLLGPLATLLLVLSETLPYEPPRPLDTGPGGRDELVGHIVARRLGVLWRRLRGD